MGELALMVMKLAGRMPVWRAHSCLPRLQWRRRTAALCPFRCGSRWV